jgi:hypothetical protein
MLLPLNGEPDMPVSEFQKAAIRHIEKEIDSIKDPRLAALVSGFASLLSLVSASEATDISIPPPIAGAVTASFLRTLLLNTTDEMLHPAMDRAVDIVERIAAYAHEEMATLNAEAGVEDGSAAAAAADVLSRFGVRS